MNPSAKPSLCCQIRCTRLLVTRYIGFHIFYWLIKHNIAFLPFSSWLVAKNLLPGGSLLFFHKIIRCYQQKDYKRLSITWRWYGVKNFKSLFKVIGFVCQPNNRIAQKIQTITKQTNCRSTMCFDFYWLLFILPFASTMSPCKCNGQQCNQFFNSSFIRYIRFLKAKSTPLKQPKRHSISQRSPYVAMAVSGNSVVATIKSSPSTNLNPARQTKFSHTSLLPFRLRCSFGFNP